MILYIIDDTPGVNTKQLFVIEGGGCTSLRIGKGIGEESRCVFIYGNTKEGYRWGGLQAVATIYYNTSTTPKLMILLYFFISISRPTILSPNNRLSPPRWPHRLSLLSFIFAACFWLVLVCVLIKWRPSSWRPSNQCHFIIYLFLLYRHQNGLSPPHGCTTSPSYYPTYHRLFLVGCCVCHHRMAAVHQII